ncbi:hypothetical protein KO489_11990 [Reinekea forsetii]|nr:hypothetical protein [Reinekea forsetii]
MDIEYYDFNEHIGSIEWMQELPKGLISDKIDIRYNTVTISKMEFGYEVYIAPKDLDKGGDGLLIRLDANFKLIDYEIERIEPNPF